MSSLTLQLPDSVRAELDAAAHSRGLPVAEYVAQLLVEDLKELRGKKYLEERARKAQPGALRELLDRVPHAPPIPCDELPD